MLLQHSSTNLSQYKNSYVVFSNLPLLRFFQERKQVYSCKQHVMHICSSNHLSEADCEVKREGKKRAPVETASVSTGLITIWGSRYFSVQGVGEIGFISSSLLSRHLAASQAVGPTKGRRGLHSLSLTKGFQATKIWFSKKASVICNLVYNVIYKESSFVWSRVLAELVEQNN